VTDCPCPVHSPDPQPENVDFLIEQTAIGPVKRVTRLTNGQVMCCICFDYTWPCGLSRDSEGCHTDICIPCGITEATYDQDRNLP
jgi:hypothetical protein